MSAVFVSNIEGGCSNYKPKENVGDEKDSDDNLDLIVTLLNLPETEIKTIENVAESEIKNLAKQEQHENYTERDSALFDAHEKDRRSLETATTTQATTTFESQLEPERFLPIPVANNSNNNDAHDDNDDVLNGTNNNGIVDEANMTTAPTPSATITVARLDSPTTTVDLYKNKATITANAVVALLPAILHPPTENMDVDDASECQKSPKNNEEAEQQTQIESVGMDHEDVEEEAADEEDNDDDNGAGDNANGDDDDDDDDENELTNLTWLTELRNQSITWPSSINPTILDDNIDAPVAANENCSAIEALVEASSSSAASRPTNGSNRTSNAKTSASTIRDSRAQTSASNAAKTSTAATTAPVKRPTPAERYQIFIDKVKSDLLEYEQSAVNYQTDATLKPPFNYSHIIGMAMLEKGRVTLQQICSWIEAKFAFFRVRKKWNNSIRHNLSLHHCFQKINRNKFEKGKGGYWELGVDPKKCDRKRIRNRKSANSAAHKNKATNKNPNKGVQLTTENVNSNNSSNSNSNNSNSSFDMQEAASAAAALTEITAALPSAITQQLTTTAAAAAQCNNAACHHLEMDIDVGLVPAEQMLLDDLDVQQNIDISSNHHHLGHHHRHHQQQQQLHQLHQQLISGDHQMQHEDAFIANVFANCIELEGVASQEVVADGVICSSSNSDNELPLTLSSTACMPQYQLGTVIISATADDLASLDVSALNSFICNNDSNNVINSHTTSSLFCSPQQQSKVQLYREDEIPPASENIIVSSFLSDSVEPHSPSSFVSMPNQPNVIVEPIEPYYSVISTSATTFVAASAGVGVAAAGAGAEGVVLGGGEGAECAFRPYIDGIDEAFQYLRSMDNNRSEDLLDNLLDISVSDY